MLASLLCLVCASAAAASPFSSSERIARQPLVWTRYALPLSGELVLTDVHATLSGGDVVALATGEGGIVLKLEQPSGVIGGAWTAIWDTSFPTYWYGVYAFDASSYLVSGFIDGGGTAYGVVAYTDDGGRTWSNDTRIDPSAWGGGPIEFANASEGYMPSTSGASAWRTRAGGRVASEWVEIVPSPGNWHAGNYVYDGDGLIQIAGSSDCRSGNWGGTWSCRAPVDASGVDSALACAGARCLVGGGEISPAVAGWVHLSSDGGASFGAQRALNASFPIRSVQAIATGAGGGGVRLIAAGGNFFSAVGGIYSSLDGAAWTLDVDLGEEIKACRALPIPALNATRVFCVSAGAQGGSIVSADVPM